MKLADLRARLAPGVAEERRRQEAATATSFKGPVCTCRSHFQRTGSHVPDCPARGAPRHSTIQRLALNIDDTRYHLSEVNIRGDGGGGQLDFCTSDLALTEGALLVEWLEGIHDIPVDLVVERYDDDVLAEVTIIEGAVLATQTRSMTTHTTSYNWQYRSIRHIPT